MNRPCWTVARRDPCLSAPDNRIALDSTWDEELLALEFEALAVEGLDLEFNGFDAAEIDLVIDAEHGESGPRRRCGQRR